MSFYESPLESPVEGESAQPAETSSQQQRPPRRADTLPVRFEEPSSPARETLAARRQPRVYGNPVPPPSRRPTYDRVPGRERRRSPTNRYQATYESEEDEIVERIRLARARADPERVETERYESQTDYFLPRSRGIRYGVGRSPSPSPLPQPIRTRVVERVVERRRERSTSPVRRVAEIEERTYSPVRVNTRERERSRSPFYSYPRNRERSPSPYRSRLSRGRRERSRSPTYRVERRSHRSRLDRDDDSELSGNDKDDLNSQTYAFTLSRHTKSLIGSDSGFGSISDISERNEGTDPEPATRMTGHKIRNILKSEYVGDGVIGGHHGVKITETSEPSSQARRTVPALFRWIHFEDVNMDFDQFQSNATAVSDITEAEKNAMNRLLGKAKKRYDKTMQTSRSVKSRYMVPSYVQETISSDTRPKTSSRTRTVSWMCIPYFCLDRYTTSSSTARPSAHPMRTLMQARFSLVEKDRDMQQAYRLLLPDAPAETCFHIAQLWFVVLDDSLLISCSRMSMSSLQGDIITFAPKLPSGSPLSQSTSIIISGRNSSLWSLPVTECQNWFAFISHFWEFWPRSPQFTYHDKAIGADDWPRILVLANKSNVRLNLDFKSTYKEPAKGILLENPIADDFASPPANKTQDPLGRDVSSQPASTLRVTENQKSPVPSRDVARSTFRVFMWLNTESTRGGVSIVSPETHSSEVYQDLTEIDDFLSHKTSLHEKLTYRGCPSRNREDLYQLLAQERREITEADVNEQEQSKRKRYETKVDILNAADSLFQFFLPPDFKGPTVDKFWGAISKMLEPPTEFLASSTTARQFQFGRDAAEVLDWLKILTRIIVPFRELFSQAESDQGASIRIPDELSKAYLHLLMSLAFATNDMQLFDEQMVLCNDLVELGMREIVQNMSQNRLSDYAIFVPTELASLMTFQVIQDVTGPATDICETYWEYIKALQAKIETNPLDRGHQDKITFLKQEISVISETLEQQQKVLGLAQPSSVNIRSLRDTELEAREREMSRANQRRHQGTVVYERAYENATQGLSTYLAPAQQHSGLDPGGVQGLLAQDAMSIIDGRVKDFREMREQASDLGSWNIQKIDSNKDRQEAAVYAFTIVTIIFLPLSTVAGILGMNTTDVRNMDISQWVFWATALPLTVLIVTLCLVWAGELNNFFEGFSKLWRKQPTYAVVPERYSTRERDRYEDDDIIIRNSGPPPRVRRSNTIYGGRENYV